MIDLVVKGKYVSAVTFDVVGDLMALVTHEALREYAKDVARDAKVNLASKIKGRRRPESTKIKGTRRTVDSIVGYAAPIKEGKRKGKIVSGVAVAFPGGLLEMGTKHIRNYEFIRPAAEKNKGPMRRIFARSFKRITGRHVAGRSEIKGAIK